MASSPPSPRSVRKYRNSSVPFVPFQAFAKSTRQPKEDCPRKLASGASVALLCRYWCCMLRLQLIMQSTQSDYLSAYLTRCTPITILRYSIHPQTMFPHISAKQAEILLLLSVCKGTAAFSLSPNTPWLKLRSSA